MSQIVRNLKGLIALLKMPPSARILQVAISFCSWRIPGSVRPLVLLFGGDATWDSYKELGYTVQTGKTVLR
jgi:hypothetical protein